MVGYPKGKLLNVERRQLIFLVESYLTAASYERMRRWLKIEIYIRELRLRRENHGKQKSGDSEPT